MISFAATIVLLLVASPAVGAVFEIDGDGTMVRLDPPAAAPAALRRLRGSGAVVTARARAFRPDINQAAQRYDVSPALVDAIARVESAYDPAAVSRTKAAGIMQLMPATAHAMGVKPFDPAANIWGGTAYLRLLLNRFDGDVVRTVAAYNAGPGAVVRARGVPRIPETVSYVAAVMDRLASAAQ
jgi:soluble lytic murein transglycosylase-like protein